MKKFLFSALCLFCASIMAHSVLLLVEDNNDGRIYIEAGLSTGGSAEGASVIIKEKDSGKPIFTTKIPPEGYLHAVQPKVPYTVTVRLSEGHEITKNGPLASENKDSQADSLAGSQTPQDKSKKSKK